MFVWKLLTRSTRFKNLCTFWIQSENQENRFCDHPAARPGGRRGKKCRRHPALAAWREERKKAQKAPCAGCASGSWTETKFRQTFSYCALFFFKSLLIVCICSYKFANVHANFQFNFYEEDKSRLDPQISWDFAAKLLSFSKNYFRNIAVIEKVGDVRD